MPFEKGNRANPGGRPKDKLFHDALRMAINGAEGNKAELRKVAEALLTKAKTGDVPAIKEVADRLDGKVPQGNEHVLEKSDALTELIQAIDGSTKPSPD